MNVEGDLGRSYIEAHDWSKAEIHTRRAVEMAEALHDERALCIYQINMGLVYVNTARRGQACLLADRVLRTATHLHDHYILGLQHLNLASLLLPEVRLNDSQRHARQALVHADISGDLYLRMKAQSVLGESYRLARLVTGRREYSTDAEHHLQQSVELARSLGNPSLEADAENEWARLCEDRCQPLEAANHYDRALGLLEKVRIGLGYEEFQLTYFWSLEPIYSGVIEFLLRQNKPDQAFLTSERLRSRLLLAQLGQERRNVNSWPITQQIELNDILNFYGHAVMSQCSGDGAQGRNRGNVVGQRSLAEDTRTSDTLTVNKARQKFLHLYESQRLYRASWQSQQSPPVVGFEDVQRLLGLDDALLSYLITDTSIIAFVATSEKNYFQHLNYPREKLVTDVEELCLTMNVMQDQLLDDFVAEEWFTRVPGDPWPETIAESMGRLTRRLEKLYALLVVPILAVIEQKTHWVIVPHGPLHRLPWAALRGAGHYLIEQHSISLLPSASVGFSLKSCESSKLGEAIFFADPELPAAELEVKAGYEFFQAGPKPFIGQLDMKRKLLEIAPNARLLHLACHHLFDESAPLLSFLKLTGNEGSDFLYAFEVAELALSAELVSLSACQSGRSRIGTGDEQIGIVRAFLAAGASSVISTYWSIEDESASAFFADFYKRSCKCGLGQALAAAQRHLISDPRYELPYFWAPYALSGSWNKPLTFHQI